MEGDEGDRVHILRCPSFFASASTFSGENVLLYVHTDSYSLTLYLIGSLPFSSIIDKSVQRRGGEGEGVTGQHSHLNHLNLSDQMLTHLKIIKNSAAYPLSQFHSPEQ